MTAPFDYEAPPQPDGVEPGTSGTTGEAETVTTNVELTLEALLQSLLEMGICASDVQETALESSMGGAASGYPGGLIGKKAAQTVEHLIRLHEIKDEVRDVMIPMDVISSVDAGKNPHQYTRDFVERVAGENMYTNGMLTAISDYKSVLDAQLVEAFPELAEFVTRDDVGAGVGTVNGVGNGNGVSHGVEVDGDVGMKVEDAKQVKMSFEQSLLVVKCTPAILTD
ncbi:hypothetical protein MNV49_000960 [Pseudohyphozyma bogoriensis]|nr:hypothetical protein MNV49_000960 [Pseudohyphozyma bogoriensis]